MSATTATKPKTVLRTVPPLSHGSYVAQIFGTDPKFGLKRTFLQPVSGRETFELRVGQLYEFCHGADRHHELVMRNMKTGALAGVRISPARAKAMAEQLDAGKSGPQAWESTKEIA